MTTLVKILAAFLMTLMMNAQDTKSTSGAVDIEIEGVSTAEGSIKVALFANKDNFLREPLFATSVPASTTSPVVVAFENVPDGMYAISIYHDKDNNNELNKAGFIPTEPYGVSNNIIPAMSAPKWNDAKFEVAGTRVKQIIKL